MSNHFSAPPMSTRQILSYAQAVRRESHTTEKLCFPVMDFLEHFLPKFDDDFNIEIVEEEEMLEGAYAYFDPVKDKMSIREDVYNRACEGNPRDRFTIAHEIGHFFLHHGGFALCRENAEKEIPTFCKPEWQANTFAGFLLMPPNLIRDLTIKEIAKKCGASFKAAKIAKEKSQTLW